MNNRGVSSVVATVMIIAITIAAVGVLFGVVVPLIKNTGAEATACSNVNTAMEVGTVRLDESNNAKITLTMKENSSALEKITFTCLNGDGEKIATMTSDIDLDIGEMNTYSLSGCTDAKSITLAPIVVAGSKEKVCDIIQLAIS